MKWVVHKVPKVLADPDYRYSTCQENARGVHFCPGYWSSSDLAENEQNLCASQIHGLIYCYSPFLRTCDFADNIHDEFIRKIYIHPAIAKCPPCANCLYGWPVKECPEGRVPCTLEEIRTGFWNRPGKCVVDETCQVRCAESRYDYCYR